MQEVDDERVAVRLGRLVFVTGVADGPAVREEDETPEVVERFATVQLSADPTPERFVGEPPPRVERAQQLPVFEHRLGQWVLPRASLEL